MSSVPWALIRSCFSRQGRKLPRPLRRRSATPARLQGFDPLEQRALLAADDITVTLVGNGLLLSLDPAGVQISDLHTSYGPATRTLTITAVRGAGEIVMPVAIPGVTVNSNADTIAIDLVHFKALAGIHIAGGAGTDSVTIGPGGVNLSAVTRGAAAPGFSIDTGAGDSDAIIVAHPISTKAVNVVSLTTLGSGPDTGIQLAAGVSTRGYQVYAGSVTLAGNPTLRSASGITFGSTLDGVGRLTLSAGGAVTFLGAIGDTVPLAGLTIAAARSVSVNDALRLDGTGSVEGSSGLVIGPGVNRVVFSPAAPGNDRTITGFSGSGVLFVGGSTGSWLTNLSSTGNGVGLRVGPGSYRDTVVSGNTFSGNTADGVVVRAARRLTFGTGARGNVVTANGGFGIHAVGVSSGTVVEGNQIGINGRGPVNAAGGTSGGTLPVPAAPGLALRLTAPGTAATKTAAAGRFEFDLSVTVAGVKATSSGGIDLLRDRLDVDVRVGRQRTEFRQIGNVIYVDASQLGATGNAWVGLNAATQADQVSVRAVSGLLASLSPEKMLDALAFPGGVLQLGDDAHGSHYRASIDASTLATLVPFYDMFNVPANLEAIAGGSLPVDVWVDARGHVSRVAASFGDVSYTVALRDVGGAVRVVAPPATQLGGLDSPSGTFLFGDGTVPLGANPPPPSVVSVAWSTQLVDGVVQGTLNATSSTNRPLRYSFLGSSAGGKLDIGTVPVNPAETDPQSFTVLPYATWLEPGGDKDTEVFDVLVGETTAFDQYLTGIPLVGTIAAPVIDLLQATPLVGNLLAPIIGAATVAGVSIDVASLAPGDTPLAFTVQVSSFDGTQISTNYFPAIGLTAGSVAPTVLSGPGLGSPGATNPYGISGSVGGDAPSGAVTLGNSLLRNSNYNVVTWDPRGEFASGGVMQLDSPFYEGRDVSALIDWVAAQTPATLDGFADPRIGMVGGSYGGGIQLAAAGTDPRIDAIVPDNAWNSLDESLAPYGTFHSAAASLLLSCLDDAGARVNDEVVSGLTAGLETGRLSPSTQALLAASGPTSLLNQLQTPTLLTQSITGALFPLRQSIANAQMILANPFDTPVKMIWYGAGDAVGSAERTAVIQATLDWLDQYVAGNGQPADQLPAFQWFDDAGGRFSAPLLPFQDGFNEPTPISASGPGGTLTISPAAVQSSMISVPVTVPAGMQVVGAPSLTFTYSGQGTSRAVFAEIIDSGTGRVVGNIVTPVPVTLDGAEHTVSLPLADIVYTSGGPVGAGLTLRIRGSASAFANPSTGEIAISQVTIDLPARSMLTSLTFRDAALVGPW